MRLTVAAADAPDDAKASAAVVCSGTDDQVVIQRAIESLAQGGGVAFTEGTFNCDGPVECEGS